MKLQTERLRNEMEITQTDLDFAGFDFSQVAAINTHPLCHLKLRPALRLAELADASTDLDANVTGHRAIMVCSLCTTNRLSPTATVTPTKVPRAN